MKKCAETDNFARWPFVPGEPRDDGEKNNGAFDLTLNPEKIDLIHEATEENGLRPLLQLLNSKDGRYMTLGCASGQEGDLYYSYLEITFRDQDLARSEEANTELEEKWKSWVLDRCKDHPGLADMLMANVAWEYREFSLRKAATQYLVTIYPRARDARDHGQLLTWIYDFFKKVAA